MVSETPKRDALLPERYVQADLFICDVADAVLKDLAAHLEHPFYSLSKKPDTAVRRYEHNGNFVEIVPSVKGMATIYDKDILIYCISQIMAALNRGEDVSRRVRINARDLLMFTNRGTAGKDYKALCAALDRLDGTRIRTNIQRDDGEKFSAFGLIDSAAVERTFGLDGRLLYCEVTLSDWVFDAIRRTEVLTLHRDYFRLRKPMERRIYEIARKHCGHQKTWRVQLELLLKKSGSRSKRKQFRYLVKEIARVNHLPDYEVAYEEERDLVTFTKRSSVPSQQAQFARRDIPGLHSETYAIAKRKAPGWDVYALEVEWRDWASSQSSPPDDPDAAFIGFCARRGQHPD